MRFRYDRKAGLALPCEPPSTCSLLTHPFGFSGTYRANAVTFDGSNDYLDKTSDLTGATDGKTGTISFWLNISNSNGFEFGILEASVADRWQVYRDATNRFHFLFQGTSQNNILIGTTSTAFLSTGGWRHLICSWDLTDTGKRHLFVDGGDDSPTWTTYSNANIDYTISTGSVVAARSGTQAKGSGKFNGDLADFWFDQSAYMDLSQTANLRKFISAAGKPVFLGTDGSRPTGAAPILFFSGVTADWHTNKGTGGGYTEIGALTDASSSPSD